MPGRRVKSRPLGPWADPDFLPPPPRHKKHKKPKQRKRFHHAFRVFLALGLMPSKARQCDPLGLRLSNRMHVMEGECGKSECLSGEGAPDDVLDKDEEPKPKSVSEIETEPEDILINGEHKNNGEMKEDMTEPVEEVAEEVAEVNEVVDAVDEETDVSKDVEMTAEDPVPDGSPDATEETEAKPDEPPESSPQSPQSQVASPIKPDSPENKPDSPAESKDAEPPQPSPQPPSPISKPVEVLVKQEPQPVAETEALPSQNQDEVSPRKRVAEPVEAEASSGSESDSGRKKVKLEHESEENTSNTPPLEPQNFMDYERDRLIQDYVSNCAQSPEEMDRAVEKLQKEVETLVELARVKEVEWNTILRLRKLKEETLERLLRRKRQNLLEDPISERHLETASPKNPKNHGSNQLMMVPIVSSSPGVTTNRDPPGMRMSDYGKVHRPILPKPYPNPMDAASVVREGRNGPVVDVKSIIENYRLRHPESIPRRGRRMRGDPFLRNPPVTPSTLISVANMALCSGSRVKAVNDNHYELGRPPSSDPGRSDGTSGYKDVLMQFAKLTGQTTGRKESQPHSHHQPQPPPPYPEVTLHPVTSRPSTPPSTSLLHGILTKQAPVNRPATFSPTLARLLTAPDRPPHPVPPPPYRPQHPSSRVSIADILTTSKQKARNEITITPVSNNQPPKSKEDVVQIRSEEDDTEAGDRLVIDESAGDEPLQCQGCKQKPAQFVCAGCGNQWYCSRECQVSAWEEHSDVCSG